MVYLNGCIEYGIEKKLSSGLAPEKKTGLTVVFTEVLKNDDGKNDFFITCISSSIPIHYLI